MFVGPRVQLGHVQPRSVWNEKHSSKTMTGETAARNREDSSNRLKMMNSSSVKHRFKVMTCIGFFVLVFINSFNLPVVGRIYRLLFHKIHILDQEVEVATGPWRDISLVCTTENSTLHPFFDVMATLNLTEDLLANISLTKRRVSEFTEEPGYFQNLTYFQMKTMPISNVPETLKTSCRAICGLDPVEMMIIIMSIPGDAKARLIIRTTWASLLFDGSWKQRGLVRLAFFIGGAGLGNNEVRSLLQESAQYGDLVVADFQETYRNLSLKLATSLKWTVKHCPQAKYVAKIDTDTFAHIPMLFEFVRNISEYHSHFIVGYKHGTSKPGVRRAGKWAVPYDVYPITVFPKYIYGHSYVISYPAVRLMVKAFPYVPIVPNEDAFITGIMAKTCNITRLASDVFAYSIVKYVDCDLTYRKYITAICRLEKLPQVWQSLRFGNCSNTYVS